MGQVLGPRIGQGRGQDTDVPKGELTGLMFAVAEDPSLALRSGGSGQARAPGSTAPFSWFKKQNPNDDRNDEHVTCDLIPFCPPGDRMEPVSSSHLQVRKLKHREIK